MTEQILPQVLCVDDDVRLLEGLIPLLRREYRFHTAQSGDKALKLLEQMGGAAVIVSDMRMPVMDGAQLLSRVAQLYPTTTRILLTGEPGRDGAVRAVNQGQIYRFLTKPCPPQDLKAAINAGVRQHELLNSEKVLLQDTLLGSIKALVDVLALIQRIAFGRAGRIKRLALDLSAEMGRANYWQLEAAALLSQIGFLSVPSEIAEKFYMGGKLTPEEKQVVDQVPQTARRVLGHIPRLDGVLQMLEALASPLAQQNKLPEDARLGAHILSVVLDFDALTTQGNSEKEACDTLKARGPRYDQKLIETFANRMGAELTSGEMKELPLREVRVGMMLLRDVRTETGVLVVPNGFEISAGFLERLPNFSEHVLNEPVKVIIRAAKPA